MQVPPWMTHALALKVQLVNLHDVSMLQLTVTSICSIGFAHKLIALTETTHASMCGCEDVTFHTLSQLMHERFDHISSQTNCVCLVCKCTFVGVLNKGRNFVYVKLQNWANAYPFVSMSNPVFCTSWGLSICINLAFCDASAIMNDVGFGFERSDVNINILVLSYGRAWLTAKEICVTKYAM